MQLGRLRWNTVVGGARPAAGRAGALIVVNARRFALAPIFTALALTAATGRPVRFVGRPDVAPVGALARRLGGLLDRPDEVAGALRAGELVVMGGHARAAPPPCRPRRPPAHRCGRGDVDGGVPGGHGQLAVGPRRPHRDRPGACARAGGAGAR